ncbi:MULTISPECIES: translational GTPase TypA [Peptostreptococcus]|uniref:translational GTPase TypA n=1 Tax=Peptostreptococcus TaxID=1257 RepID=UPI00232E9EC7|nr:MULTISPECIES: translational GTPase TypA [Peptostreptococcus]MDB8820694.1 translational GTPase TypA [Peptostreptococcus anaerobius]MDB8825305.1 translational GTPase TypA [Peptostreptococcus anaerobius]MDB8827138.1 translational GTPase TypA [Peptostreptococcus anaerobius]MDB8829009.1 translational GTPase TypA [Peptostreptococcus anaerobius]MDB8830817.1 translational GTPase TypA [Peptostreptococcus anaerobius]
MSLEHNIINIAVIAHVDAGKSTLVDAFLNQSGVFRDNEVVKDCVMDSNDLEQERGITIYSKNCSIRHDKYKINIVDTPGHSDFSSEVERVLKTVDTVILLVDATEGPMPQTRFVLQKSLEQGLRPILFINKIDKKDQRAEEVVNEVFDLFVELNATDEQCDFPIVYGIAKQGIAIKELDEEGKDLSPLFETIINHVDAYPDYDEEPLQVQISALAYDDYIGRLGIGRVFKGKLDASEPISICSEGKEARKGKISKLSVYEGLKQVQTNEAVSGEMVVIAGISDISIGETICAVDKPLPMGAILIEEPTLSMNFMVNDSPFVGRSGKFVTTRHIKERLEKELEVNVGLRVEPLETTDGYRVSGRGELHLSILIENMRREGYELGVSKPQVLMHRDEDGNLLEPVERVTVSCPETYSGSVINELNLRKGMMESMEILEGDYVKIQYIVPTRGLLGYRSEFINVTRGEGTLLSSFERFEEYKGEIPSRLNGVLISQTPGKTMGYALNALSSRGTLFVDPGLDVYEGMIIGMNSRKEDMVVNPCKNKKMSNVRASGSDDAIKLAPPKIFTLEESLEFIEDDELVEVTPDSIRLRKKILNEQDRVKYNRSLQNKVID